jgi:NAD(P)H dehydrogenase (quinone)
VSTKLLVAVYSFSGHTIELARAVAEGAREISDIEVELKQIPEFLPEKFFSDKPELTAARSVLRDIPYATTDDLLAADGIAFGSPVHFGSFASQWKQFIDQLSPVFVKGSLVNKPVSLFVSAGSVHGGEEAALLSMMVPLLNLGMLPVGVPYPIQGQNPEFDAGSPYGAVFVTGHRGEKPLAVGDATIARILGKRLAAVSKVIKVGAATCPDCAFLADHYDAERNVHA